MGISNLFSIPNFRAKNLTIKAVTSADDLYTDEQGRHVIFRNIGGQVRPIHVGPEDYAEWLVNQNVNIDPADQKTLREIDKELEIMEKAAEYGGAALQKKYEDYFKKRREQYNQIASGYYQTALQNQAEANNISVDDLVNRKKENYEKTKDGIVKRKDLPNRGWDSSLKRWVESQDSKYGLDPSKDDWYYTRLYGVLLSELVEKAKEGVRFSDLNLDNVFSNEFFDSSLKNHYAKYFAGEKTDPKKVLAAIKTMQQYFLKDAKNTRGTMQNFLAYWYNKMEKDFASEPEETLSSDPNLEVISDVPKEVIPESLPNNFTGGEKDALMSLFDRSSGSKLSASHRVILHGLSRVIDSIPEKDRVSAAVELSNGDRGLHASHKEGYQRAFIDHESLGLAEDRRVLVNNALDIIKSVSDGSSSQKVAAMKKVAMLMGMIDGDAVISSNPGIKKQQFMKRWSHSATNAGRAKSEGPGLIDLLVDDNKRNGHTYSNQELKIIHSEGKKPDDDEDDAVLVTGQEEKEESNLPLIGEEELPDSEDQTTPEEQESEPQEEASFRVPLFDFPNNLTKKDRELLDSISEYVSSKNLSLSQVGPAIYRVSGKDKFVDILYNKNKKQLIGVSRDDNDKILPIPSLSLEEIEKILDQKSSGD